MNYYQSLNTNNKIIFLKYQICKLKNISKNYCDDWENYIEEAEDPEWDMYSSNDEIINKTEKKIKKINNLLNQKELKLKLIKKLEQQLKERIK